MLTDDKDRLLAVWKRPRAHLTSMDLKIIACISMLISHLAQTDYILYLDYGDLYNPMTAIGRLAFPIFCFCTVQGMVLTRNRQKYLARLLLFSLISEIPFDLAFSHQVVDPTRQNVIWTLFLGGLAISLIQKLEASHSSWPAQILGTLAIGGAFCLVAIGMETDYSWHGILAIVLLYLARNNKALTTLVLLVTFAFELWLYGLVYLAIPLILFYNGKRGKGSRWFFYIFYPGHLLAIYLLKSLALGGVWLFS